MRLGKGEEFGKVLVDLRSAEESYPPAQQSVTKPEPSVPDDPSEPVRTIACIVEMPGNSCAQPDKVFRCPCVELMREC